VLCTGNGRRGKRCAEPADLNRRVFRSRRRTSAGSQPELPLRTCVGFGLVEQAHRLCWGAFLAEIADADRLRCRGRGIGQRAPGALAGSGESVESDQSFAMQTLHPAILDRRWTLRHSLVL
jgi:hypothetical protein